MSENLSQIEMLKALAEADKLEHEQIESAQEAQISKWPKGKSPGERTGNFVVKTGSVRRPRHSGQGYHSRKQTKGPKYWVSDLEKAEEKAGQRKIEEALAEKTGENVGNPHEADWSPAEWEAVFHALGEPDWATILQEMNDAIDAERERDDQGQYILPKDDKGREMPLPWDQERLRKEVDWAKRERNFGKMRFG